ncbi:uncharacterized protein TRAVEDRAFT_30233 [Trametes versicolor FP-101664 SS1]|uniref:uncharacterized protein n=1 Tax=Trametes versicolor (strain FP-101664) TaxID=717944 RepID=UPI00046236B5|nr:uncharacterized protein TRAVEDRAFT_30233 [Trametes versicolor FP-101664 SS1]EIW56906.1 hypothetical protein TRAVEDRAFT_30233 [Trametes versicolor FP-101664 SS1]
MPRDNSNPFDSGEPSFHMISAAVRLGQKYQMSNLFEHAIGHLGKYYTTQFDVWEAQTRTAPLGFHDNAHSIGVVNLARLTGEASLLPVALLCCCMLRAAIITGFKREDGTREQLALDDIGRCFVAKGRLIAESVRIALCVFEPIVAKKCTAAAGCKSALATMLRMLKDRVSDITMVDPFLSSHDMFTGPDVHVCRHCKTMLEARDLHERRAVWARLPEILGIDPIAAWPSENADGDDGGDA